MSKIKDLPELDRPREKAIRYGIESLSDYELLSILIGSGSLNYSANDIAYAMLNDHGGLSSLIKVPYSELLHYKGMGSFKAIKIIAAFEIAKRCQEKGDNSIQKIVSPEQLFERYRLRITSNSDQEIMYLVILNKKREIIHETTIFKGTKSSVNYSIHNVIQKVLINSGKYFYVIHNHPSGDITPSKDDLFFTETLRSECRKFEIKLLDHLIISTKGFFSFDESEKYVF